MILFTVVFLALIWVVLTGDFTLVNLGLGLLLAYAVLWVSVRDAEPRRTLKRGPRLVTLTLYFVKELMVANIRVALAVLGRRSSLRPGIVAVPLAVQSDVAISVLANLITLTPGTLSLDVSTDRRVLYVHSMHVDDVDEFRRSVKDGLERRVLEVFE